MTMDVEIALGENSRTDVAKILSGVLSESYLLMLKTHNYHWNVEGPNFHSLHEMFQDQYEDLFDAVDDLAEQIRALGHKAPGKFSTYAKHSDLAEGDENADAKDMVIDLIKDNEALVRRLRKGVDRAAEAGDEGSADLMIERMQQHTKNAWMLRAISKDDA